MFSVLSIFEVLWQRSRQPASHALPPSQGIPWESRGKHVGRRRRLKSSKLGVVIIFWFQKWFFAWKPLQFGFPSSAAFCTICKRLSGFFPLTFRSSAAAGRKRAKERKSQYFCCPKTLCCRERVREKIAAALSAVLDVSHQSEWSWTNDLSKEKERNRKRASSTAHFLGLKTTEDFPVPKNEKFASPFPHTEIRGGHASAFGINLRCQQIFCPLTVGS